METIKQLPLMDLISEKHSKLRRDIEKRWSTISPIEFTHTEWFLLGKCEQESISISNAAKMIGISRQAMQKCARKLQERGFVDFYYHNGNRRDKYIELTENGRKCSIENNKLKIIIEKEIIEILGNEIVKQLKETLVKEW